MNKKDIISLVVILSSIALVSGYVFYSQYSDQTQNIQQESEIVYEQKTELIADEPGLKEVLYKGGVINTSQTLDTLNIGIITDTQVHASRIDKMSSGVQAKRYLKPRYGDAIDAFVERMMVIQPQAVFIPGDIIEGTNDDAYVGMAGLKLVKEKLDKIDTSLFWVMGNHDLRSVTRDQFIASLGISAINDWYELGQYRIITIDSNYDGSTKEPVTPSSDRYIRGYVPEHVLEFLERALDTDKETIVVTHHPPALEADGMPKKEDSQLLVNAKSVQDVLARNGADIVISGHVEEKLYFEEEGVEYFVLPGAIKSKEYKGAFYEMKVMDEDISMIMWYQDPITGRYTAIDFISEEPITQ